MAIGANRSWNSQNLLLESLLPGPSSALIGCILAVLTRPLIMSYDIQLPPRFI